MTYSKDNLRQIFQQPFNQQEWQTMLRNYFHATELKAEPERIEGYGRLFRWKNRQFFYTIPEMLNHPDQKYTTVKK